MTTLAPNPLILGIDIGGTKSAALLATPDGDIRFRVSGPTPAQGGPDAVIPFLIGLAREALAKADAPVVGVGVSAGAPAHAPTGRVFEAPNLPGWGHDPGVPLADILSAELGGLPVYVENDADATALAEHRFGAGQGVEDMAFLTVGTGVGAGLVLGGRLHRGANSAGGEVGHICVEPGGRLCACGMRGCVEAYASGPSLVRIAKENGYKGEATGQGVVAAARNGDTVALAALDTAGEMLGRGIASLCMLVNPARVVLGTLAVHAGDLLLPRVRSTVVDNTWPRLHQHLEIVPAALGDRAQDLAALCVYLHRQENN
jgi:glucokinase